MYFMILVGASPAMQGVVEEKQQRISEVLLGSISPFGLILGKLLGVVAVALTVGALCDRRIRTGPSVRPD